MEKIKSTHYVSALLNSDGNLINPYLVKDSEIKCWNLWGSLVYSIKKDTKGLIPIPKNCSVYRQNEGDGTYSYIMEEDKAGEGVI
ncbi:MAG: hypothetical protein PVI43_00815 [Candidatus Bathyarchaeota archaeon]|jgi:hypothetical protein